MALGKHPYCLKIIKQYVHKIKQYGIKQYGNKQYVLYPAEIGRRNGIENQS